MFSGYRIKRIEYSIAKYNDLQLRENELFRQNVNGIKDIQTHFNDLDMTQLYSAQLHMNKKQTIKH